MSLVNFDKSLTCIATSGNEKPLTALAGELSYMSSGPWLNPLNTTRARICFGLGGVIEQVYSWSSPTKYADGWGLVQRVKICL